MKREKNTTLATAKKRGKPWTNITYITTIDLKIWYWNSIGQTRLMWCEWTALVCAFRGVFHLNPATLMPEDEKCTLLENIEVQVEEKEEEEEAQEKQQA